MRERSGVGERGGNESGGVFAITAQGKLYLIVAIDRTSKFAFVELHEKVTRSIAADFQRRLIPAVPLSGSISSFPTAGPTSSIPRALPNPLRRSRT
jgi:hypothetical protein